jgi:hypothetical protein
MAKPFDATLKDLFLNHPHDWLRELGLETGAPVSILESDLSTVTAQADRVLLVQDEPPWILNPEFQSGRSPDIEARMLAYAALLIRRHGLPVHSVLILLRPEADDSHLTGIAHWHSPKSEFGVHLNYQVIRVWEQSVAGCLAGGYGTLPLAVVAASDGKELAIAVQGIEERLAALPKSEADVLRLGGYILSGLRHDPKSIERAYRGIHQMEESSTYRLIIDKGRAQEAQRILFNLGTPRLGDPQPAIRQRIERMSNVEKLEAMIGRIYTVQSWRELLN